MRIFAFCTQVSAIYKKDATGAGERDYEFTESGTRDLWIYGNNASGRYDE